MDLTKMVKFGYSSSIFYVKDYFFSDFSILNWIRREHLLLGFFLYFDTVFEPLYQNFSQNHFKFFLKPDHF